MIDLQDVTVTFPDGTDRVTAVDRVWLTVAPGTVTAVTGPSGSGKSSLLAVAATLIRADSGTVRVGDVDVTPMTHAETALLRRTSIGIVFQQPNLLPSLTALEQLEVMNELGGPRRRRGLVRDRARCLLADVGMGDHLRKRPHQLSGGQRQRVNIARALMNDPSALIVDEPTSSLDSERGAEIIDLILDLTASRGTATLLVTHDLSHLPRMHAVLTMADGRITPRVATTSNSRRSASD